MSDLDLLGRCVPIRAMKGNSLPDAFVPPTMKGVDWQADLTSLYCLHSEKSEYSNSINRWRLLQSLLTLLKRPRLFGWLQILVIQRYGAADNVVELVAVLDFGSDQVLVVEYHWTVGGRQLLALARSIVAVLGHHADCSNQQQNLDSRERIHRSALRSQLRAALEVDKITNYRLSSKSFKLGLLSQAFDRKAGGRTWADSCDLQKVPLVSNLNISENCLHIQWNMNNAISDKI